MSDNDDKLVLAANLEEASPRQLVHVDNKGRTRSPARYRAITVASYGAMGALVVGAAALWASTFGLVPGLLIGGGFAAWTTWILRPGYMVKRGTHLLLEERYDEAIAVLSKARSTFAVPRHTRALAEQNLGMAYAWQGKFEQALAHQRAARKLYRRRGGRRGLYARMVGYSEITTLVNLDRIKEARARLDDQTKPDSGSNYLEVLHWSAELYVCMGEGRHEISEDDLHARALVALRITTAAALIALIAWAHHSAGDEDQAWHLLREAYDRDWAPGMRQGMPVLMRWMEAHRKEAGADDQRPE
jgi:tetratricopeptide (TPR) repeat protein